MRERAFFFAACWLLGALGLLGCPARHTRTTSAHEEASKVEWHATAETAHQESSTAAKSVAVRKTSRSRRAETRPDGTTVVTETDTTTDRGSTSTASAAASTLATSAGTGTAEASAKGDGSTITETPTWWQRLGWWRPVIGVVLLCVVAWVIARRFFR